MKVVSSRFRILTINRRHLGDLLLLLEEVRIAEREHAANEVIQVPDGVQNDQESDETERHGWKY